MKYLLSLIIIVAFASCEKEKDPAPAPPTKTQMLSSGSWKYESGGVDQGRNGTVEISFATAGVLQPCILDNSVSFQANGTGSTDEGVTKCNPAAPQNATFSWSFGSNETTMNISGNVLGLGGQFRVLEISDTKFTIAKDTTLTFGIPMDVALVVNLKH